MEFPVKNGGEEDVIEDPNVNFKHLVRGRLKGDKVSYEDYENENKKQELENISSSYDVYNTAIKSSTHTLSYTFIYIDQRGRADLDQRGRDRPRPEEGVADVCP